MMEKLKFILVIFLFSSVSHAEGLKEGNKYKTINISYLIGEYKNQDNKYISKETVTARLSSALLAKRYFTAFRREVPIGTVMTILGPAPKPWYLYFQADAYFVKLDPDLSQGLDVEIKLNAGMEGNLDGLNPEIFERM